MVGLTIGLTLGLLVSPAVGIATGLQNAISAGEIIGLRTGGFAWLHHMAIRLLLWSSRGTPLDYLGFLDYAVDLVLLQSRRRLCFSASNFVGTFCID
jgi:hypothetical protein